MIRTSLCAAMVLGAVPAAAQIADPYTLFMHADTDHDGRVTRAEFLKERDRSFDRMDADRDGRLSRDELTAATPARTRWAIRFGFGRFDSNGDGWLSRAELHDGPTPAFDRVDRNKDGTLDRAEVAAARATD